MFHQVVKEKSSKQSYLGSFYKKAFLLYSFFILLSNGELLAQTISTVSTAPNGFISASGGMRVRNFNSTSTTIFVGETPGTGGKFNTGTTVNGASTSFEFRWVALSNTLSVYRGSTTLIQSYVYNIKPGLNSPNANMLKVSMWSQSTNAAVNTTVNLSSIKLNGINVNAALFTCSSVGTTRVSTDIYLQNSLNGIDLNTDFTFAFTLNLPNSPLTQYSGNENCKVDVGIGYIQNPTSVISGAAVLCSGSSANNSIALTGNAPWNLTYTDGTTITSVNNITASPYVFSVAPSSSKAYTVTALSDLYNTAAAGDRTGISVAVIFPVPLPPTGTSASICGTGSLTLSAMPGTGETINWYAAASGGTALLSGNTSFTTPTLSITTVYYAESRNTLTGCVSSTRTPVTATIKNAPSISSFVPLTAGPGVTVTLTGTNFTGTTSVSFGGINASSFTINSSTSLSAIVGAGSSGNVSVINSCGNAALAGFTFSTITTWTGSVNNNWTNPANWNNGVPTSVYSVIIPTTAILPQIISNQAAKSITILPGATINITQGNSLSISNSLISNGTTIGGGSLLLNGNADQSISGDGIYNNLTLDNNSGATIASGAGNLVNITGMFTPAAGILTTNDRLTLKSTAGNTATIAAGGAGGGYIIGTVNLERYISAKRAWRLISFPITSLNAPTINKALQEGVGGTAASNPAPGYGTHITGGSFTNGFDQNASGNSSMKEWNGTIWKGIVSTNLPVNNALPYFLFVRGSRANNLSLGISAPTDNTTVRITANIKQGNQSIPIGNSGWQLVGNPFPSKINLDGIALANRNLINRNFKFWDPKMGGSNNVGGYVTASFNGVNYDYIPAPISSITTFAQPFSAFYLDAVSAGNLVVAETDKCNCGTDNVFRPLPSLVSKIFINLRSDNNDGTQPVVDGIMTAFDSSYTDSLDEYDATKLENIGAENLAIVRNLQKLSVERRNNTSATDTMQLDIANMRLRNYQLEFNPQNFDTAAVTAYIQDSYTGLTTNINLSTVSTLGFSIINNAAAYASNRFSIIVKRNEFVVLPVSITNITAAKQGNKIMIEWHVENEINIAGYEIEKSLDGVHFTKAGTKNSQQRNTYNWFDNNPTSGINFYRIRIMENDGHYKYSHIVSAVINNKSNIRIFPNPIENNTLQLQMNRQPKGKYHLAVYCSTGQCISSNDIEYNGTDEVKRIILKTILPKGTYSVEILNLNNIFQHLQFIVE